jgi:hypothetical protein
MKYTYTSFALLALFLIPSCADEDLAMLGAVATGAAANYAGANGDAATAASLLDTQQQIMNEEANTEAYNAERRPTAQTAASPSTYVTAKAVPGKPGFAISPTSGKAVDVDGIPAGTLVEDPTAPGSRFRVPQNASSGQNTATTKSSGSGITGTWSNSKLTWKFGADGNATMTVPSVNSNGVSTTYMTYKANPSTGVFAYTISRATLTGTLNCNGQSDYDMPVNKSYTEKYSISGDTLKIGTEVMTRN